MYIKQHTRKLQYSPRASSLGGFSLIEVLVSLSIFAIVVTIAVGSLMVLITANSKAQNMQSVMTNLSYVLDSMTREIRTGSSYFCGGGLPTSGSLTQDCAEGESAVSFNEGGKSLTANTPNNSRRIAYRFNNAAIERRLGNGDGNGNVNESSDWLAVTAPEITVTDLWFHVTGSDPASIGGNTESPTVTLYIEGHAGDDDGTRSQFDVQTTIVQQLLDI